MSVPAIRIDIISDIVCPWCLIGHRQLERALETTGLQADIRWHPFELNPAMPEEGEDVGAHIARKYGATPEQAAVTRTQMADIARPLGIDFTRRPLRIWNSFKAHQLLYWAKDSGLQTALKRALFDAYFVRGENVSDETVLLTCVGAAGLDPVAAKTALAEGWMAPAVRALEAQWARMQIGGVPAFILAERVLLLGAQGEVRLADALLKVAARAPEG